MPESIKYLQLDLNAQSDISPHNIFFVDIVSLLYEKNCTFSGKEV